MSGGGKIFEYPCFLINFPGPLAHIYHQPEKTAVRNSPVPPFFSGSFPAAKDRLIIVYIYFYV